LHLLVGLPLPQQQGWQLERLLQGRPRSQWFRMHATTSMAVLSRSQDVYATVELACLLQSTPVLVMLRMP
jgi:hypothetical protein